MVLDGFGWVRMCLSGFGWALVGLSRFAWGLAVMDGFCEVYKNSFSRRRNISKNEH